MQNFHRRIAIMPERWCVTWWEYKAIDNCCPFSGHKKHCWQICDLKVTGVYSRLHMGQKKHCYFLCFWERQAIKKNIKLRSTFNIVLRTLPWWIPKGASALTTHHVRV
jgi:hypothetical protein